MRKSRGRAEESLDSLLCLAFKPRFICPSVTCQQPGAASRWRAHLVPQARRAVRYGAGHSGPSISAGRHSKARYRARDDPTYTGPGRAAHLSAARFRRSASQSQLASYSGRPSPPAHGSTRRIAAEAERARQRFTQETDCRRVGRRESLSERTAAGTQAQIRSAVTSSPTSETRS